MRTDQILQRCQEFSVSLARFLYCDNGGVIRGKSTGIKGLPARLEDGIGLTVAMMAMNSLDQLQPVEGMGPVGEIRLVPDPESFVVLPYAPRTGAMLVDLVQLSGQSAPQCPRSFLWRMSERLEEHAGVLEVAFENGFSLRAP